MYTYMLQAVMSRYTSWLWIHNQTHTYVDVRACVRIIYMKNLAKAHTHIRKHTFRTHAESPAGPHAGKRVVLHRRDALVVQDQLTALGGAGAGALERGAVVVPRERAIPKPHDPGCGRSRGVSLARCDLSMCFIYTHTFMRTNSPANDKGPEVRGIR